jgi:hypothetical protein
MILSYVRVSKTNNNDFWIGFIDTSTTITLYYNYL